ncbi:hypothetical protein Y5S_00614 [Alcanivorax nanhaiticus]|jgi:hypothetical protein|uniref:Uncharacterized protein n=1 Tax=Alcanivorax nanhaiticus TaxID=1177154 RepID=A0A095SNL2_9GAMM|nr:MULTISPECIES: AVAST type 3 anti-phage proein Avs3b [Gammaproteobacteria]KGD66142.1 hypothetical protein Y5S_00614 [Alcanivorax nanhaiticus]|tara:strand:+ start:7541 stop:8350 length:810 start_codon:yes stop_codon:yes gene_type:complete
MTTNENEPEQSSSFSTKTDKFVPANSLLALGQKLVQELGLEESTDTLGRWMAHHIADLMINAENAIGDEKAAAERKCFDAILELWKHRSELPNGKRPFEDLEPVMRAIESLDPEDDTPRYYRAVRPPKGETVETSEQEEWLSLVDGLDYTAKVLIGYCLTEAADAALDKSKEWIELATAIDDQSVPEIVIRYVSTTADVNKEPDPNKEIRSLLDDRIKRLRGFLRISESLANTLEQRIQSLPAAEEEPADEDTLVITPRPRPPDDFPSG